MNWTMVAWPMDAVVSSADLRQADLDATRLYGIEPLQLMEVAGWQVARFVDAFVDGVAGKRVAVVAGSGNNGGDALCAARFLRQRGADVSVALVSGRDPLSLASHHAHTIRKLGIPVADASGDLTPDADVIVDGLFGTGIRLPVRDPGPKLIAAINRARRTVVAIDVPSGMDADDAAGDEQAVQANATLTLVAPKAGLARSRAAGRVFLADIGMPAALFSTAGSLLEGIYRIGDLVELEAVDRRGRAERT